jgi:hypothetical protein
MKRFVSIVFLVLLAVLFFCCLNATSPEQKSLNLARTFVMANGLSAEKNIEKMIEALGNDIKPLGWYLDKKDDGVYLVRYKYELHSINKGIGERGYFFEVDPAKGIVTDVTDKYLKKMKPLSGPYKNESEIVEDLMNNSETL